MKKDSYALHCLPEKGRDLLLFLQRLFLSYVSFRIMLLLVQLRLKNIILVNAIDVGQLEHLFGRRNSSRFEFFLSSEAGGAGGGRRRSRRIVFVRDWGCLRYGDELRWLTVKGRVREQQKKNFFFSFFFPG